MMSTVCGVCGGDLRLERETFDEIDHVYVGALKCPDCGRTYLDQRKPSQTRPGGSMAKTQANRPKRKTVVHRLNTVKGDGTPATSQEVAPAKVPIGEAMRLAVAALGDVVINDELAPQQLRELAECYQHVTEEQAAYDRKSEDAKVAKKSLESATELLLEKVRMFTHPSPLPPLFDKRQAEKDLENMVAAGHDAAGDEQGAGEASTH